MKLADSDAKCLAVQKMVYKLRYNDKPVNSYLPERPTSKTVLENGQIFINDIQYGNQYPNSYLDIWYADSDFGRKKPTIVYFHGGGFLFGDKNSGDPLAQAASESIGLLREMIVRGYNLVNANYALAPECRYPVQIMQVDQVMGFLLKNADEYGLDMSRIVLAGGSAGADLTEIYGLVVSEPAYAARLGIVPSITRDRLKVLAIDESALDARTFDENMHAMLGTWLGEDTDEYSQKVQEMNVPENITGNYIPSFINSSNEGIYFIKEAEALDRELTKYGIDHELYYRDPSYGNQPHGYMNLLDANQFAREAFEQMMQFIARHTA